MEDKDYKKMQESASELAGFLIRHEIGFSQNFGDCFNGLGIYFDIKTGDDKMITIFFRDNGYTDIEVKE